MEDECDEEISVLVDSGCEVDMVDSCFFNDIGLSSSCVPLANPRDMDGTILKGALTHSVVIPVTARLHDNGHLTRPIAR